MNKETASRRRIMKAETLLKMVEDERGGAGEREAMIAPTNGSMFIDTAETLGFYDEHDDYGIGDFIAELKELDDMCVDGWSECPDWMPCGLPGYEWKIVRGAYVLMKPAPRAKDVAKYKK